MYQRVRISIMALVFIVLLLGIANAAQVTVVAPNNGENLFSGKVYDAVEISIDYNAVLYKPAKYRLSYWCKGAGDPRFIALNGSKIWRTMAVRYCSTFTGCYPTYLWEVPFVTRSAGDIRSCKVKVELYKSKDAVLPFATDQSDYFFFINPFVPINGPE